MSGIISRDPSITNIGDGTPTGAIKHLNDTKADSASVATAINNAIKELFPVGAIYISTNNTNPGEFISGTTWISVNVYISGSSDATTYAFKRTA